MEEKKQNYIIIILVLVVIIVAGIWASSYFRSAPDDSGRGLIDMVQLVPDHPRGLMEGYILEVNTITREIRMMVILDMFANHPESTKEVIVKIDPNTEFRILHLPSKDPADNEFLSESPATLNDFRPLNDIAVVIAGDIREILERDSVVARSISRLD